MGPGGIISVSLAPGPVPGASLALSIIRINEGVNVLDSEGRFQRKVFHSFIIHSFIQQIFTDYLLFAWSHR